MKGKEQNGTHIQAAHQSKVRPGLYVGRLMSPREIEAATAQSARGRGQGGCR